MTAFFVRKYLVGFAFGALALAQLPLARAAYNDISESTGIDHIHSRKSDDTNNHAGAAAVDVDGDGLTDLLFARYEKSPLLYMNQGDGTFVEEAAARGLEDAVDAASFGAGDFDNDGDPDLFMAPHHGSRMFLYVNDGTGNFTEEALARGADLTVGAPLHRGYSIGLVDYNLDGFLDVYISEWGVLPSEGNALRSALLRNRGAEAPGHFEVVTEEAGLVQPVHESAEFQFGFSTAWADFDGDGWPDLALIADFGNSQMYWNDGDGTFTRGTSSAGVGLDENGMGVAVADYDGDGLLDFYVTSIYDPYSIKENGTHKGNKLYRNLGDRTFQEVASAAGVDRTGWGWGTAFFEYNNNGNFDLIATNGFVAAEGGDPESMPFVPAASDPTTLFANLGNGRFRDVTIFAGIADAAYGKGLVVLDYDNDGDEDFVVVNSYSPPVFYESDASTNGNEWIRFRLEGTLSNRDGIGTLVKVTDGGRTRTLVYNPSNAYIGQREGRLHFGLGAAGGVVDQVELLWPSGVRQTLTNVASNTLHLVREPDDAVPPPRVALQPVGGAFAFGSSVELTVAAAYDEGVSIVWEKDGEAIPGAAGPRLSIPRIRPSHSGAYRARLATASGEALSREAEVTVVIDSESQSVARWWNEFMMEAVRNDFPDPPIVARNLYHASAAMWDAFWAYEEGGWARAEPVFHQEAVSSAHWQGDRLAAQREAISHAVFTVLVERFKKGPRGDAALSDFRWLMQRLGYDPASTGTEGDHPAAVGNRIGRAVLELNYDDGSNELNGYADTTGYAPVNEPLIYGTRGTTLVDPNRWQPLSLDSSVTKNGIVLGAETQAFLAPGWNWVEAFALEKPTVDTILIDPGPQPLFGSETQSQLIEENVAVIEAASVLDPNDDVVIDVSPGALMNNPFLTQDGEGRAINPFSGQPYAPNWVKRGDYWRVTAEFWSDGPGVEGPPGIWNMLHNQVTDDPRFQRKLFGVGPALSKLEWDVHAYLALNGAMHDAAIAAWAIKAKYDSSRPISTIRYMGALGQSSDPDKPAYHARGLPLREGLIELVTAESAAPGGRHEGLSDHVGEIALYSWQGVPVDPQNEISGVGWVMAKDWVPYHLKTFPTPNFAGYVSGHSAFSRAAAEVLALLSGSPYFPGGLKEFHFQEGKFLRVERGPSEDMVVQVATYYDASDLTGIARLYCGVHIPADDFVGRRVGARAGVDAALKVLALRNAGLAPEPGPLSETVSSQPVGQAGPLLARIYSEEGPLPMRAAPSSEALSPDAAPGIVFALPEKAEGEEGIKIVSRGEGVVGANVEGQLGAGESLAIEFKVAAADPVVALAYAAGPSLADGAPDTQLTVYREGEDGWVEIDRNDDWLQHDAASRTSVLRDRGFTGVVLEEKEAALPLLLAAGRYRVELTATAEQSGRVRLALRGQRWIDSGRED